MLGRCLAHPHIPYVCAWVCEYVQLSRMHQIWFLSFVSLSLENVCIFCKSTIWKGAQVMGYFIKKSMRKAQESRWKPFLARFPFRMRWMYAPVCSRLHVCVGVCCAFCIRQSWNKNALQFVLNILHARLSTAHHQMNSFATDATRTHPPHIRPRTHGIERRARVLTHVLKPRFLLANFFRNVFVFVFLFRCRLIISFNLKHTHTHKYYSCDANDNKHGSYVRCAIRFASLPVPRRTEDEKTTCRNVGWAVALISACAFHSPFDVCLTLYSGCGKNTEIRRDQGQSRSFVFFSFGLCAFRIQTERNIFMFQFAHSSTKWADK